jgi:DNA processing protein
MDFLTQDGYDRSNQTELNQRNQSLWLRFALDSQWSAKTKLALLEHFEDLEHIYTAPKSVFDELDLSLPTSSSEKDRQIKQHLEWLKKPDHHFIHLAHQNYPSLLREIANPPLALFAIGDLSLLKLNSVAIVGNRRPTPLGANTARLFASSLAEVGVCVVSGLALGIDACAHQGALQAGNQTIAVLGCGLDITYPSRHHVLKQQIADKGLLLSEFALNIPAKRHHFPQRNRIISGLCHSTVIIEAAQKSGTLLTARLACEQNREVLVVPGSINSPNYQGSHQLIRDGACLVSTAEEVLESIPNYTPARPLNKTAKTKISTEAQAVLAKLESGACTSDTLMHSCQIDFGQLSLLLLELEISNLIRQDERGYYTNIELS